MGAQKVRKNCINKFWCDVGAQKVGKKSLKKFWCHVGAQKKSQKKKCTKMIRPLEQSYIVGIYGYNWSQYIR